MFPDTSSKTVYIACILKTFGFKVMYGRREN